MKYKVISIDLAKNIFQLCAMDQHNKIVFNKKVKRENLLKCFSNIDTDMIVMIGNQARKQTIATVIYSRCPNRHELA